MKSSIIGLRNMMMWLYVIIVVVLCCIVLLFCGLNFSEYFSGYILVGEGDRQQERRERSEVKRE